MVRSRLDGGWLEDRGSWAFVQGENSTRFLLVFEEPGNEAGEPGVLVMFNKAFGIEGRRREDVEGGLGGRASGTDMVAVKKSGWRGRCRHRDGEGKGSERARGCLQSPDTLQMSIDSMNIHKTK